MGHSTAHNAINSPLLRLPGELRNRIWDLCYGDMTVGFGITQELGAANPFTGNPLLGLHIVSRRSGSRTDIPKLVCKQVWYESSQVMFATATFAINSPETCRILSKSSPIWLQYIRRLAINIDYHSLLDLRKWAYGLTFSLAERFTNLEGLRLYSLGWTYSLMDIISRRPDFLTDERWVSTKMPSFIRSLQQHKLKPELTTVSWTEIDIASGDTWQDSQISEVIRTELLTHRPRRKSRRGKHGDGDSI